MIPGFIKNLVRIFALACIFTAAYLNIIIVPDSHKTILAENTKGIQLPLLEPGYHWNWTRFVPLKWSLFHVNTNPPAMDVRMRQPLRYGRYMEDPEIFSFDITIKIKYKLTEQSVLFFWNYLNKDVNEYPQYIHARVKLLLETYLSDIYNREDDVANFGLNFRRYISNEGNFINDWKKIFENEGIELLQYDIVKLDVPEAAVYLENIRNIDKIFQARREATAKKIIADAVRYEKQILDEEDLKKARKFGELMQEYPDVIKYYQIEKINPKAKIVLQNQPASVDPESVEKYLAQRPNNNEKTETNKEPAKPAGEKTAEKGQIKEAVKEPEAGKIQVIEKTN